MCHPALAIDVVVRAGDGDHVWMVRRRDTLQLATMGGFVETGETTEQAVQREMKEEMGLDIASNQIRLFGVYSDPRRDNRRHTVSAAYVVQLDSTARPVAGDDAKKVERVPFSVASSVQHEFFADHRTIFKDYARLVGSGSSSLSAKEFIASDGDIAPDIVRSICRPFA